MKDNFVADRYYLYGNRSLHQGKYDTQNQDNDDDENDLMHDRPVSLPVCSSTLACFTVSLQTTVCFGVIAGLFAAFLHWLELNVSTYCLVPWIDIPEGIKRTRLIVDIIEGMVTMFWTFSCIAPVCGWSTTRDLNILHWCTIAAFMDAISRFVLFTFQQYGRKIESYCGYVVFLCNMFFIYHRYLKHRLGQPYYRNNTVLLTLKLSLQFSVGFILSIPFNYIFLEIYNKSAGMEKTILTCGLIIVFAIPKFLLSHIITNIKGVYSSGEGINFAVALLTATTLVSRLVQARSENLVYFMIISFVHGIFNVIDKLSLPLRRKLVRFVCKCKNNGENTHVDTSLFLANQSLISIITETTSVIFSSAAAYILLYYYKREESTGQRYNGFDLFKEMATRSSIAVAIELIFNVFALKIHAYLYSIPVINVWKSKWKFIVSTHFLQIFFIVIFYSRYIDNVLLRDYLQTANSTCIGFFQRI